MSVILPLFKKLQNNVLVDKLILQFPLNQGKEEKTC